MAKCDICGKGPQFGHNVSHSNLKTNRRWDVNAQRVSVYSPTGRKKKVWMCTRCVRNQAKVTA